MLRTVTTIGGGQLVAQAVTAVLLLAVTRDAVAQLGVAATYYGIAVAAAQFADAGASTRVLRDGGLGTLTPGDILSVTVAKPLVPLGVAAAVGVVSGNLPLTLAVGYAVLRGIVLVAQSCWQVEGLAGRSAAASVTERLVALAAGVVARGFGVDAPVALCGGLVVGALVVVVAAAPGLLGRVRGGRVRLRTAMAYGLRFVGVTVAGNLVLLDSAVVTLVAGAEQAGLYAVGARMLGPVLILVTSASAALMPALAAGDRSAEPTLRLLGLLSVAGLAVVFVAAPVLVPVLVGHAFTAAVPALRCYLVAAVFVVLAQLLVIRLQARGQEVLVSVVLPLGVLLGLCGVGLGAAWVPGAPAAGAACGYAAACVVVTSVLWCQRGQRQRDGHRDVPPGDVAQR